MKMKKLMVGTALAATLMLGVANTAAAGEGTRRVTTYGTQESMSQIQRNAQTLEKKRYDDSICEQTKGHLQSAEDHAKRVKVIRPVVDAAKKVHKQYCGDKKGAETGW